jgi:hypothetical protein
LVEHYDLLELYDPSVGPFQARFWDVNLFFQ